MLLWESICVCAGECVKMFIDKKLNVVKKFLHDKKKVILQDMMEVKL